MKGYGNNVGQLGKGPTPQNNRNGMLPLPRDSVPNWGCGSGFDNWGNRTKCFKCGRLAPFSVQGKQQRAMANWMGIPPQNKFSQKLATKNKEIEELRKQLGSHQKPNYHNEAHQATTPDADPHKQRVDTLQPMLDVIPASSDNFVLAQRKHIQTELDAERAKQHAAWPPERQHLRAERRAADAAKKTQRIQERRAAAEAKLAEAQASLDDVRVQEAQAKADQAEADALLARFVEATSPVSELTSAPNTVNAVLSQLATALPPDDPEIAAALQFLHTRVSALPPQFFHRQLARRRRR